MKEHTYIAIDLKSFYASVECRERGLDPRWTRTLLSQTKAVPTRPSALQLHLPSSPTVSQAVAVYLKLSSEPKRPTPVIRWLCSLNCEGRFTGTSIENTILRIAGKSGEYSPAKNALRKPCHKQRTGR